MSHNTTNQRRTLNMLRKRLGEAHFELIDDPRSNCNRRWSLPTLLRAVAVGLASGARHLKDVERLTDEASPSVRRFLGVGVRRIPDTTLRDVLCRLTPDQLRPALHQVVKAAHRRKALASDLLPFGVCSVDGKGTAISGCDDHYAQRQTQSDETPLVGVVRTMTATLTSCAARPILDVVPIPASTNEMGHYEQTLRSVHSTYSRADLFRLVTYDAGACSADNAKVTRDLGLHYLFSLKCPHTTLLSELHRVLGTLTWQQRANTSSESAQPNIRTSIWLAHSATVAAPEGWEHLRTVLRVRSESFDAHGRVTECLDRYFVSSLPVARLTPDQWLRVVRQHWGVELAHQTLDQAFAEDDKPWIIASPQGMLAVAVLRRLVYTTLTLYRSVTLRSDTHRTLPWKDLLRRVELAFVSATDTTLAGLRQHRVLLIE